MLRNILLCTSIVGMLFIAGCASHSSELTANYQSANIYYNYDCSQLAAESAMLNSELSNLSAVQDKNHRLDKTRVAIGTFLFWPTYFFIKGDGAVASNIQQIKGKLTAVDQAMLANKCTGAGM